MTTKQIEELRRQRAALIDEARGVVEAAEAENRDLTGEEGEKFDRLEADAAALAKRVERAERMLDDDTQRRGIPPGDGDGDPVTGDQHAPKSFAEFNERRSSHLPQDQDEYRRAFYRWMTVRDLRELSGVEQRALSKATAAAGANLVPTDFERVLIQKLRDFGVMRQLATVFTTDSGETIQIPTVTSHGTAAWTAENAAFTASDEAFGQASLSAYKAATIMQVSEELLQDAAFDLDAYISDEFGQRVGVLENTAYVVGDGTGKPTGITTQTTAGKTGATGQTTSVTTDDLIDLQHSVIGPYRRNGSWLMNDATVKAIRKLKDADNQYIWAPGLIAGSPDTLLGRPVYADPDMPVMAANAKSILYGDFRFYRIRDVRGIAFQRLVELYAANGQVGFRAYHRTDGKLLNTDAVRHYQNSAT